VYDAEGKQLRGYAGLAITGRAGTIDSSRSKKVWRGPHFEGGPKWQNYLGMYFTNDQWDGSDFSLPGDTGWMIVTERVMEALKAELFIPNVEFQRLTEVERDAS
jgi:hypothetical protein